MDDRIFVEGVVDGEITETVDILNWYRNLYYKEPNHSERGIMANAINDLFAKYKDALTKTSLNPSPDV